MEIDLSVKCRACLKEKSEMHYLFAEFDQGLSLYEILQSSLNLEISQNDSFPSCLCHTCTSTIVEFFNFKTAFVENEEYLKTLVERQNFFKIDNEESNQTMISKSADENMGTVDDDSCSFNNKFSEEKHEDIKKEHEEESIQLVVEDDDGETDYSRDNENYICFVCGDYFLIKNEFQQHMSEIHSIDDKSVDNFLSKPKESVNYDELNHPEIYINEFSRNQKYLKQYTCIICGHTCKRKSDLIDHSEVHSEQKKYICPYCGKAFQRRTVLVKHKRIHTHPRQAICELCGKAFNDKDTLKTHIMLVHIKSRNFHCDQCGLTFPLKATLEKHIRRHNPDRQKEFICKICNMAYKDKSSLNRHISGKHSNSDNIKAKCDCGKEYTSITNLIKHQNKHHSKDCVINTVVDEEHLNNFENAIIQFQDSDTIHVLNKKEIDEI